MTCDRALWEATVTSGGTSLCLEETKERDLCYRNQHEMMITRNQQDTLSYFSQTDTKSSSNGNISDNDAMHEMQKWLSKLLKTCIDCINAG